MTTPGLQRLALEVDLLELETAVAVLSARPQFRRELFPHEHVADFAAIDATAAQAKQRLSLLLVRARRALLQALANTVLGQGHSPAEVAAQLQSPELATSAVLLDSFSGLVDALRATLTDIARTEQARALQEVQAQGDTEAVAAHLDELAAAVDAQARRVAAAVVQSAVQMLQQAAGELATGGFATTGDGDALARRVLADALGMSERALVDLASQAVNVAGGAGRLSGVYGAARGPQPVRWYASELLDTNTCPPCERIDGTQYDTLEQAEQDYPVGVYVDCQGGARCRGTLVAVLDNEVPSVR